MTTKDLVSVIIPVYDSESYLLECLKSLENQSYDYWEAVIVDDASTDKSHEIAREWSLRQKQCVLVLRNDRRRGPGYTRNRAIARSQGEFVSFLDADDIWRPHRLISGMNHFRSCRDLALSYGRRIGIINARGKKLRTIKLDASFCFPRLLWKGPHSASNVMTTREILELCKRNEEYFAESLMHTQDSELWWRVVAKTGKAVRCVDDHLIDYRVHSSHGGNVTRQVEGKAQALELARAYIPELVENYGSLSLALTYRYLARRAIALGNASHSLELIVKSIHTDRRVLWLGGIKTVSTMVAAAVFALLRRSSHGSCKDRD